MQNAQTLVVRSHQMNSLFFCSCCSSIIWRALWTDYIQSSGFHRDSPFCKRLQDREAILYVVHSQPEWSTWYTGMCVTQTSKENNHKFDYLYRMLHATWFMLCYLVIDITICFVQEPSSSSVTKNFSYMLVKNGTVVLNAESDMRGYIAGQIIKVSAEIENKSEKSTGHVVASLMQVRLVDCVDCASDLDYESYYKNKQDKKYWNSLQH